MTLVQLYVWQPHRTRLDDAERRLRLALDALGNRLRYAYGHEYLVHCAGTGLAVVGTLGYEGTIEGPQGWVGDERSGGAFAGVIEGATSNHDGPAFADLDGVRAALVAMDSTVRGPDAALALGGRWSAAVWEPGLVAVVNGAAAGRSLWRTDGPDGWAVGSRAGLLVDLVGRQPELDLDRAALAVQMGYVAGSGSLYAGVRRVDAGMRIVMDRDRLHVDRPIRLEEILGPRLAASDQLDDVVVDAFAQRVSELVLGELEHARDLRLHLSGGRDSRLLAAAAVALGKQPRTSTGGRDGSPDVVGARRVAAALGLPHTGDSNASAALASAGGAPPLSGRGSGREQPMTVDRLASWISLSDGTAPASLAWVAPDLSTGSSTTRRATSSVLCGLGGETHRGAYFPGGRDVDRPGTAPRGLDLLLDLLAAGTVLRRPVRDLLAAEVSATDGLEDRSLSLSEWLSRFHWRFRENCRGSDTLDRADLSAFTWAPLMNVSLLAISRNASAASLASDRMIEAATLRLAPQLRGVPYDRRTARRPTSWTIRSVSRLGLLGPARRIRRALQGENLTPPSTDRLEGLTRVWHELYFGPGSHVWPDLIEEGRLRRAITRDPDGSFVKSMAIPELLLRDLDGRAQPDL